MQIHKIKHTDTNFCGTKKNAIKCKISYKMREDMMSLHDEQMFIKKCMTRQQLLVFVISQNFFGF